MGNTDTILSDINNPEVEASYMVRVLANLVDWVIEFSVLLVIYFLLTDTLYFFFKANRFAFYITVFVIQIAYRLTCILLFEKTIGMMLLKIKYLNENHESLSGKEKLIAALAYRTAGIRIYRQNMITVA